MKEVEEAVLCISVSIIEYLKANVGILFPLLVNVILVISMYGKPSSDMIDPDIPP